MSKLGLVGIGAMGSPMARKLLDAGHRLYIHDIEPGRATALSKTRAIVCDSAAEVARQADIVFLMVGTAQDVEKAIFGPRGAIGQLREGSLVVCMSTMPAADARLAAARLAERAVGFLDAPVSGGTSGARDGSLSIMVGGEREDFDTALPYLQAMGRNITLVGGHGSGQTAKAANQIIVSVTRAAVGEALLFAKRDGCDPEQVRRALLGGYAQSHTLENYGKRQAQQDNPVEFGSAILKKDLDYIAGTAKDLSITLPLTSLVRRMYNQS